MSVKSKKTKQKTKRFNTRSISKSDSLGEHVLQYENELTCGLATFAYVCDIPGKTDSEKILNAEQHLLSIGCVQKDRRVNSEQMKRALNQHLGIERGFVTSIDRVAKKAVMYLRAGKGMFHWVVKDGEWISDPYEKDAYHISELSYDFSRAYNLD